MISGLPFDDLRELARRFPQPDAVAAERAGRISRVYADRAGPAGRLDEIGTWLAGSTGRAPRVLRPVVALFAGTYQADDGNGVAEVQAFVDRCAAGGGAVNQACAAGDIGLKIFDLALDVPVGDISAGPALDEKACAATVAFGMESLAGGTDLLILSGNGGSAGMASAEAVLRALLPGAGPEPSAHAARALAAHRGHLADPLEALRRLGGREIAALAGAIVAARTERVPVILDGRAALAAAAVVSRLGDDALSHCMLADGGADPASDAAARALDFDPLLNLAMGTHDGAAGAIAASLVKTAALVHAGAAEYLSKS